MKKRILAVLTALVMMIGIVPIYSVLAANPTITFTVNANKSTIYPGDVVDFNFKVTASSKITTWTIKLDIPSGFTYVANSGAVDSNFITITKADGDVSFTEGNKMFFASTSALNGFDGVTDLAVGSFKLKANNDAELKNYDFGLNITEIADENVDPYPNSAWKINKATVKVEARPIPVTGVSIAETLSVKTGERMAPSFEVLPANATNKAVSFTSSDPAVATVDATTGEVTGVKEGQATITIKTTEGNFTDTCLVTVACSHAYISEIGEKPSDCKTQGWDAHAKCDDCGQLFKTDKQTEIDSTPYRVLSNQHTGGTKTCTAKAVCTVCNQPYGEFALHSYTDTTKNEETLKTPGNCRDKAVYYYSCAACKLVERDDNHTFEGDKVPTTHVGGTKIINDSAANHKTQTAGYTGDKQCLGCQGILERGTSIDPGAHTPGSNYEISGTEHWKVCNQTGCGVEIIGSRGNHTSTGNNVATCQKLAKCDVCGIEYGTKAGHDWATTYSTDATGHWYACKTGGCTEKKDFETHTPDHQGAPSDEYAIKCTKCQYEIHAQLAHIHVFDKDIATDAHLATEADCKNEATYFKSCKCGANGTITFSSGGLGNHKWDEATCSAPKTCSVCKVTEGESADHAAATEWKTDKDSHWHICKFEGCDVVIDSTKAAHVFGTTWKSDKDKHWNECVCGMKANETTHADADKDGKCDICAYNVGAPVVDDGTKGTAPSSPQTGDGTMTFAWMTLAIVSAFAIIAFVTNEKKRIK